MDELGALAARVVMGAFAGPELPDWMRRRLAEGLGSLCLFGSNIHSPEQLAALTADIHAAGPAVFTATDEEGGDVTRLHRRLGSPHPGNAALGAVDDLALTQEVAAAIGAELAAAGIDLDLAPVVDVNSNPDNPVIGVRSFGADPELVARHASAYVTGLQGAGVGACAKHWPGHGDTSVDSHLGLPRVDASLDDLERRELVPFAAAVKAGTAAVMTSHVLLPALDAQVPATFSRRGVDLLRRDLGFDGVLVSDALDMKGASEGRGEPAAAVLALSAGVDLLCLGPDKDDDLHDAVVSAVVAAVRSGELDEERLREAADRVTRCVQQVRAWREAALAREPAYEVGGFFAGPELTAGQRVADRAIRVSGVLPPLQGALVLRVRTAVNIAAGEVPWGELEQGVVLSPARVVDVGPGDSVEALVSRAAGAPVVVLVRELHRHEWAGALVSGLVAGLADVVVVEMGWPGPDPLPVAATVWTYGGSRANAKALDAVLASGSGGAS